MNRLALLLVLLFAPLVRAEKIPFHATSLHTSFAIAGDITGEWEIKSDKVTVTVTSGYLVRQPCRTTSDRRVKRISAFLAGWPAHRRSFMDFVMSAPLEIGRVIAVGETISLNGAKFEIPIDALAKEEVQKAWLAFSIVDEVPGPAGKSRGGTCYIHTTAFLSGALSRFPPKRETLASGDLKILEAALSPVLTNLEPKCSLVFLPEENAVHADYRTKSYTLSSGKRLAGGGYLSGRSERGPDEEGFMLTAWLLDAGAVDEFERPAIGQSSRWKTDEGMTPVAGTQKQLYWSLSYGPKVDLALLERVRQSFQNLAVAGAK